MVTILPLSIDRSFHCIDQFAACLNLLCFTARLNLLCIDILHLNIDVGSLTLGPISLHGPICCMSKFAVFHFWDKFAVS